MYIFCIHRARPKARVGTQMSCPGPQSTPTKPPELPPAALETQAPPSLGSAHEGPPVPAIRVQSNLPDRIIEVPVVRNIAIQPRVVERPEVVVVVKKVCEKVQVQHVVKHVPKVKIVERVKIEPVPEYKYVSRPVIVPKVVVEECQVPKIEERHVIVQVPKVVKKYVEKIVEVPHIQYIDRVIEVPRVEESVRKVINKRVVQVPVERVRCVPKIELKQVEKVRYVPGDLEIREIPVEKIVVRPVPCPMRHHPHPVPTDHFTDSRIDVPVPGNVVHVPVTVETPRDRVVPKYVPGHVITRPVRKPVEKIVEVPVPQIKEEVKVVQKENRVVKEYIKKVDVVETVEEIVDVPRYVYIEGPRTIIKPKYETEYYTLPAITTTAPPVYRHESAAVSNPELSLKEPVPSCSDLNASSGPGKDYPSFPCSPHASDGARHGDRRPTCGTSTQWLPTATVETTSCSAPRVTTTLLPEQPDDQRQDTPRSESDVRCSFSTIPEEISTVRHSRSPRSDAMPYVAVSSTSAVKTQSLMATAHPADAGVRASSKGPPAYLWEKGRQLLNQRKKQQAL